MTDPTCKQGPFLCSSLSINIINSDTGNLCKDLRYQFTLLTVTLKFFNIILNLESEKLYFHTVLVCVWAGASKASSLVLGRMGNYIKFLLFP